MAVVCLDCKSLLAVVIVPYLQRDFLEHLFAAGVLVFLETMKDWARVSAAYVHPR